MKKYPTMKIRGVEFEVAPEADIVKSGAVIGAVRTVDSMLPVEGSTGRFPCSVCSEDCTLAPSGQSIYVHGKNKVICIQCLTAGLKEPS